MGSVCESIAKTSGGETLVQKLPAHVKLEEVIIAWFPDGRTPVFLTASARDAETYCSAVRRAAAGSSPPDPAASKEFVRSRLRRPTDERCYGGRGILTK